MALPASARDLFGIPLPPHEVIRELRSKIHRAAGEVKSAGRQAAAEIDNDDDDDGSVRHTNRARRSVRPAPPITRTSPDTRYQDRAFDGEIERSRSVPERTTTRTQRDMSEARDPAPIPKSSSKVPQSSKPAGDNVMEFGRPVPGKRGMVYPPGGEESSENMIDVEGFQPGEVVRDPRTGALFRVP